MKRILLILLGALTVGGGVVQAAHVVNVEDYGYKKVIYYSNGRRTVIWRHRRYEPVGERTVVIRHGHRGYYHWRNGERVWIAF
jgi:type I site-specific restriction endonuclease